MNEAIATVGSNALVLGTEEEILGREVSSVELEAMAVVIKTDVDYANAAEHLKSVKRVLKKVTDYWEPLRIAAKKTYDNVLARKKQMTGPLENAEKILKGKIAAYNDLKERQRRERENAMRLLAQKEAEAKLAEAVRAEEAGDAIGSELAMAEAEMMDDVSRNGVVAKNAPTAAGVSASKTWKITGIDPALVPCEFGGKMIRPVDDKAVLALIKASKGTVTIPGIQYEETVSISVRA